MIKNLLKTAMVLCAVLLLAGCDSGTDNTLAPTPLQPLTPSLNVVTHWQNKVGHGNDGYYFRMRPVAYAGMLFVASRNGQVAAINQKTGQTVWQENVGEGLTSGVGAGGGNIYIGTSNANVIALSAKTGQVVWRKGVTSEVWASPAYSQSIVLVHTITGNITALSASTGKRIWRYDENVPSLILHAASQPEIAGDRVIAGFADGNLVVLNLQTGNVMWQQQIAMAQGTSIIQQMVDITVDPVVVNGVVYVATYQGRISAMSLDNGQLIWTHKISSFAGMTADRSQIYITDADSRIWCFDEQTGAVKWRQTDLLGRQVTGPAILASSVVVADRYGYMHFLSRNTGKFQARFKTGAGVIAQPVSQNGMVFVLATDGRVWGVSTTPYQES